MERIRDALEKARQQRGQGGGEMPQPSPAPPRTPSQPVRRDDDIKTMRPPTLQLDPRHLERNRIVAHTHDHTIRGPIDLLRIKLLHTMHARGWRTLGVVSPTAESGKTVLSINVAMSIARMPEKSALLVDLDLRSPSVLQYLGVSHEPSMTEFLMGECNFEDVLSYPQLPRFVVAGTQRALTNSAEILASNSTGQVISGLKSRYPDRIVIFDLPPILAGDDSIAVLPRLDCAMMVVAEGTSTRTEVEEAFRQLPSGTSLIGTVFNKAEADGDLSNYGY